MKKTLALIISETLAVKHVKGCLAAAPRYPGEAERDRRATTREVEVTGCVPKVPCGALLEAPTAVKVVEPVKPVCQVSAGMGYMDKGGRRAAE